MKKNPEKDVRKLRGEWRKLLIALKADIGDDFRADEDCDIPSMCVTVAVDYSGATLTWAYQTGDNSYSGGCYGKRHWGIVALTRRANCRDLALDLGDQLLESLSHDEN